MRDWKSLQGSELKSVNLGQTMNTPVVSTLSYDKENQSMEANFMDPNNFNRWFRKFSVDHGFGSYEGKRIVRYVRRTIGGETIKKAYSENEWADLQEQLTLDPELRHREQICVYKTETRPFGYQGLSAHMLRHTQATLLIGANTDIKTVQGRLGHSSIHMTLDTYSHALAANDTKAANVFESMLDHANADSSNR